MKNFNLLFILSSILLSCDNDDESTLSTNELNGQWNLVSVSCECEPINLEVGEHLWTFSPDKEELAVVNHVEEPLHTLLETGTYDLTVTENTVTIQSTEYEYYFEDDELFLADRPESDGPLITFVRD